MQGIFSTRKNLKKKIIFTHADCTIRLLRAPTAGGTTFNQIIQYSWLAVINAFGCHQMKQPCNCQMMHAMDCIPFYIKQTGLVFLVLCQGIGLPCTLRYICRILTCFLTGDQRKLWFQAGHQEKM